VQRSDRTVANGWSQRELLLVGGPDGLDPRCTKLGQIKFWSFVTFWTLPHQCESYIAEQIYRAVDANELNHPYHR